MAGTRGTAQRGAYVKRLATYLALLLLSAGIFLPGRAEAARQIYKYEVDHPQFGAIGTYTNVVDRDGTHVRVDTELHIAVKVLGITLYRQDAQRTEFWEDNRFVGFQGVTITNGERLEIRGVAQEDGFSIVTPEGKTLAPADIRPTNPWTGKMMDATHLMSTRSGRVENVRITGGKEEDVDVHGQPMRLRHFEINGPRRQVVWLDKNDVAVFFQAETNGTLVDFVLTDQTG